MPCPWTITGRYRQRLAMVRLTHRSLFVLDNGPPFLARKSRTNKDRGTMDQFHPCKPLTVSSCYRPWTGKQPCPFLLRIDEGRRSLSNLGEAPYRIPWSSFGPIILQILLKYYDKLSTCNISKRDAQSRITRNMVIQKFNP